MHLSLSLQSILSNCIYFVAAACSSPHVGFTYAAGVPHLAPRIY